MSQDKAQSTSMQEDAARVKDQAARQGSAALDDIKKGAQSLGSSLGSQAKQQAAGYVEGGKDAVTQNLDDFAQAIRRASDELSQSEQTMASQLVRQAASGLESLSRSVNGSNIDDMIDSVRRFGRRNPTAFIGGAVLVGLALGRFARASGQHDSDDWQDDEWRRSESWRDGERSGDDWRAGRSGGGNEGISPRPYSGPAYPAGESSSFASSSRSFGDTPAPSQGYAGGGMDSDPIQSTGPSSERDESVTSSSYSGGSAQPGSISTGERS